MKNIAIVSNTSWYIYNFRRGLLKTLIQKGYTVYAIAPADKFVDEIRSFGCSFIELKNINNKGKNPFQDISLTFELRRVFKANKIDVCLFFTPKINIYGSIAIKFSRIRAIATINGLGFVFNDGQPGWLQLTVKQLYRFAFKSVFAVFFQNEDDKLFFKRSGIITPVHRVTVVKGSGVDLEEFSQKINFNRPDRLVFLLCSRLIKEKGLYEYFEAARNLKAKYPGTTFALLGLPANNPSAVSLEVVNQFHKNNIINYWGVSDNMSSTLNDVDVMVLPSYYREGVPRILIEGLAKGLPIITTHNVGCKETVDDNQNGYLVPIKDARALEMAIENMILMPEEERLTMAAKSRKKAVAEFNEALNHQAYLDIL